MTKGHRKVESGLEVLGAVALQALSRNSPNANLAAPQEVLFRLQTFANQLREVFLPDMGFTHCRGYMPQEGVCGKLGWLGAS
jgi:hypothetical protein